MKNQKVLPFEAYISIILMLIVAAIAIDGICIQKLPAEALRYPIFCFIVLFATSAYEIIRDIRKQKQTHDPSTKKPLYHNKKSFLITVGMLVAYVILMWLFGFIVSSIALTVAFTWYYKTRNLVRTNIVAALVIIGIYFVFSYALYIFLPKGLLFNLIF